MSQGKKGAARPPPGGVPKNIVLAKPAPVVLPPESPTKPPVVRVAPTAAKAAPPGIAAPGGVPVAVISKDKLAYFKDNVADSAEDFDPTDYYYHRDRELMAAGQAAAGAPANVVPGMPQLTTAPPPGQKQILTHSGGVLPAQPVAGTSSAGAILGSAPYVPSQYPPASTAAAYGNVMQGSMNGRIVQPQILAGPPRVMSSTNTPPTANAALRSSGTDPRLMTASQPPRSAPGVAQPSAVAMRGAQPTPATSQLPTASVPTNATTAGQQGGQRLLLRERSYSGNSSAGGAAAPRSQSSNALPTATMPSPRGQQQGSGPIPVMRAGAPPVASSSFGSQASGPNAVYSMGAKGGASATLNYQMNDNVVNRPLNEKHEDVPNFDSSDFPALGRGGEFSIQNEDFPALPGSTPPSFNKLLADDKEEAPISSTGGQNMGLQQHFPSASSQQSLTLSSMNHAYSQPRASSAAASAAPSTADRFGLLGLLSVIRMTDPDLNVLALGTDLTTLGLNLNSPEALYPSFASPWTDGTSLTRRYEPEYYLPLCYYMQAPMQPPQLKLPLFSDDTLFYIFYSMPKDVLQLAAAYELYNRDWRYHKELQRWFTRVQGTEPTLKTPTYERGSYIYYEFTTGDKMRKDNFTLVYDMLEERPQVTH